MRVYPRLWRRQALRDEFLRSVSFPMARPLIRLGVNPFDAHMRASFMDARQVANRMNWEDEAPAWRTAMSHDECVRTVQAMRTGRIQIDTDMVIDFCEALDITPDQLARPAHPEPAPRAIVEAAVDMFADGQETQPGYGALRDFLAGEVMKARRAAEAHRPGEPTNRQVLEPIERFWQQANRRRVVTSDAVLSNMLGVACDDGSIAARLDGWADMFRLYCDTLRLRAYEASPLDPRVPERAFDSRTQFDIDMRENRIGELFRLDAWAARPETDTFLRAEAAGRFILTQLSLEDLRLDPPAPAARPIISLDLRRGPA